LKFSNFSLVAGVTNVPKRLSMTKPHTDIAARQQLYIVSIERNFNFQVYS